MTGDDALVEQLKRNWRAADLSDVDRAMLEYAHKLTLEPWAVSEADIQTLRAAGFDDTAILDINQVTAYYAYVNRVADGLGVELEEFWEENMSL